MKKMWKSVAIIGDFVYRKRWWIAAALFILCVVFGINGSSIGEWSTLFGMEDRGLLLGVSREIRGDEWATSTPMALSQYFNPGHAFPYFSDVVRGMTTDVFLEYGQPVKSLAVLFRPFHWGYLFLPPSMGLAFYWCGRYIMLFMVSFEMGMLLVKQRKRLALIYAFFIVWSPLVQWWFAINGLVEMLIYVQLSIILLRLYLSTVIFWKRVMCVVGVAICAGGFVLALYPAWMIPLGYILLGLIIWSFWEWNKKNKITRLDAVALFIVGICFLGLMAYIFSRSWETIVTIMNTSYPGERFETGGGYGEHLFNYVSNIWYALKGEGAGAANVCEAAQFIDFFPLCYILPSVVLLRDKIKDKLMIILLIVSLFLEIYAAIGYPALVAKYTFLSMCTPYRVYQITGFGNVILLVRSLALLEKPFSRGMAFLGGSLISYVSVGLARQLDPEYYSLRLLIITFGIFFVLFYLLFRCPSKNAVRSWGFLCFFVMAVSGILVNPIRRGCENIYEIPVVQSIQKVHEQDERGLWIVEGLAYPMTNLPIMVGAPTINSTNIYPALERWKILDPNGEYYDIYNRYAHIWINLKESGKAEFYNQASDCLTVNMTLEDMKRIGAKYLFTGSDLMEIYGDKLSLVMETENYKIYQIK